MPPPKTPIYLRWLSKVDFSGGLFGCWVWVGGTRGGTRVWDGGEKYGVIRRGGRSEGKVSTHRLVVEWILGADIPGGIDVDHLCRNRLCCNPLHLDPVPKAINAARSNQLGSVEEAEGDEWSGGDPFATLEDEGDDWATRTDLDPFATDSGMYEG